ncbi:type II secretion system F family protein [Candidatus Parcubacteria bacterium]|nr:type II secretion system F family protein [Candidatus Parcubacteria bacterium]
MKYAFTAKNREGVVYSAEEDAKDKLELYAKVRSEGGSILTAKEVKEGKSLVSLSFDRVNTRDKIVFAKNLSSMLAAGLSLPRAMNVMERESSKSSMQKFLRSLSADVSKGEPLSTSLAKQGKVSSLFVSMVKAGEESGNLSGSLIVVAREMEKSYTLTRRVQSAMIYPVIIVCLMIVIAVLLLIYMVPTLTSTFQGLNITLPLSTRVIIATSSFLVTHTLLALSTLALLVLGLVAIVKSSPGKKVFDTVNLRLPLIGTLLREIGSARTARTLSSLLSAGVTVDNALDVTANVLQNHLYKRALLDARLSVQKGEQLSSVFSKYPRLYPPFVSEMSAVGEETGKLAEMLENVAIYYEEDVDNRTKDLSSVIEPLLMVAVGIAVGIFAVSMLAPTYSLVNLIQ